MRSRWARAFAKKAGAYVLAFLVLAGAALHFLARPAELTVLCSNNAKSCTALAEAFAQRSGYRVRLLRVSTAQALERLQAGSGREFDVWIGGPTDAYASAEQAGLLEHVDAVKASSRSIGGSWHEIYGGILGLCVADGVQISSWNELKDHRVILPSPLTSGTAATFLAVQHQIHGDATADFLRELHSAVLTYTPSGIAPARLVAEGRGDVAVTFSSYCEAQRAAGAQVHTVYPVEGTSFELGGAAVLRGTAHLEAATEFLKFVTGAEGQLIGAAPAHQAPVSDKLGNNLESQLRRLNVPVLRMSDYAFAAARAYYIDEWHRQVYRDDR